MTDEEFAKSIGATPIQSSSDDDFAKSIGAVPIPTGEKDQDSWLGKYKDSQIGPIERAIRHPFTGGVPGASMESGTDDYSLAGIYHKINDATRAGLKATASVPAGVIDQVLHPINSLMGNDEAAPMSNLVNNIFGEGTKQQQAYDANVGNVFNALDPQMMLPTAHPTAPRNMLPGIDTRVPRGVLPAAPVEPVKPVTAADIGAVRIPDPLANQSELGGGAGAFDNIRRQTAGTPDEVPGDITNTPMERITDSLLNGKDAAAVEGAKSAEENSISTNYWKQRALEQQAKDAGVRDANAADLRDQATKTDLTQPIRVGEDGTAAPAPVMDALARSTEGIQYEQVPPDGSIPGNSPTRGITVPRNVDPRWSAPDENGIPVRQGLPQEPLNKPAQDISSNTPEANDLGNAIQEANGPKLGPDETYGNGPLQTESQPFNNLINKRGLKSGRFGGSQRGSIEGDLLGSKILADAIKKGSKAVKELAERWYQRYADSGYKDETFQQRSWDASIKAHELEHLENNQGRPTELGEIHPGFTHIPVGTMVEAQKGFGDPFKARVIGSKPMKLGDKIVNVVRVEDPNGRVINLGPDNITAVYKPRSLGGKQSGGINPQVIDDIVKAAHATGDLVSKATNSFYNLASKPAKALVGMLPEDHMSKVAGEPMIYRPEKGESIAAKAVAQGKMDTSLWKNVQSGLALAAEKTGSIALKGIGQWLNWADKQTHHDNRIGVDPVQGRVKKLDPSELSTLHKIMMREQGITGRMSDADLAKSLSSKGVEAYKALRGALDAAWQKSTATRKALGLPPVTREEAYHASLHNGDFKQSFYNKDGKLVWHVASLDRLDQIRAENWIKKNVPGIDWDRSKSFFGPESTGANVPRDVMSAYQQMMKFFDPADPTTTLISDAISKYNQEHGIESKGFDERFLDKANIPGFEGNKPWLSDKRNAEAFMNSQMSYLRNANHWNNLQEALGQMEPILKNPELIKNQPNIMQVAAAHVSREIGITGNKLAALEASWAKYFPKIGFDGMKPIYGLGTSRGSVYKGVGDIKGATYMTMLGANVPYMITTPLQAVMSVAQHRLLSSKGFDHNILTTTMNSLRDVASGLAKHSMSSMTGKDVAVPISGVGRKLLQYAEDNGILDKTVMDETGSLGGHAVTDVMKKTIGQTITAPEKIARFSTFVAFAHHLMGSGKLSMPEALRMAEDFTNHSLTSMRRSDKPLVVDKLGAMGNLGYVFKSYLFNYYNQLSQLTHHGLKTKDFTPLAALLGTTYLLGGALSLPGVNEADGAYDLWKTMMAGPKGSQDYKPILPLGVKGTILKDLPTWASIGTASSVTGSNLGTRFNNQIVDLHNPLGDVAVPIQEGRELMSFKDFAMDPTMRNAFQALHANVGSTAKGAIETHMDSYKNLNKSSPDGRNADGTQSYRKANDINSIATDYKRTADDESKRSIGMYSDTEYKNKQLRYANDMEQSRVVTAYNRLTGLAIAAGDDGDTVRARALAGKALRLIPDRDRFTKAVQEAYESKALTPEQREAAQANTSIIQLQKLQRLAHADH